jgi:hypothetical protein
VLRSCGFYRISNYKDDKVLLWPYNFIAVFLQNVNVIPFVILQGTER